MNGSVLVLAAIGVQALTNGVLSEHLTSTESLLLSFTAFGFCALVFGLVARLRRQERRLHGERLHLMLLLNVATAVAFLGFYTSLTMAPAPLAAGVETGIGPLVIAVGGLLRPHHSTSGPRGHLQRLMLGTLAITLAVSAALRASDGGSPHGPTRLWTGLALAGIAGTAAAGIAVISHRLGALDVAPVTVTAHRFHLTYLLAFALLALKPSSGLASVSGGRIAFLALLAVAGIAAPLFVLQIGMQHTTPVVVTLLASAVPGMTYLTAVSAARQSFDPIAFTLVNGSLVLAFLGPTLVRRPTHQQT